MPGRRRCWPEPGTVTLVMKVPWCSTYVMSMMMKALEYWTTYFLFASKFFKTAWPWLKTCKWMLSKIWVQAASFLLTQLCRLHWPCESGTSGTRRTWRRCCSFKEAGGHKRCEGQVLIVCCSYYIHVTCDVIILMQSSMQEKCSGMVSYNML